MTQIGEIIFDINQDGWVERVSAANCGLGDSNETVKVVKITRINENTEYIFRVAIDANRKSTGSEDWSYQCANQNGDGQFDLQIGPGRPSSITPKVTFYWDSTSRTYKSPSGSAGPSFRVVPETGWDILQERYDAGKLTYPFGN